MSKTNHALNQTTFISKMLKTFMPSSLKLTMAKNKSVNHDITHLKRAVIKRKFQFAHSKEKTAFLAQMPEEYAKRDLQFT